MNAPCLLLCLSELITSQCKNLSLSEKRVHDEEDEDEGKILDLRGSFTKTNVCIMYRAFLFSTAVLERLCLCNGNAPNKIW